MRNLNRISNYYNRLEAWKDWYALAERVAKDGWPQLVKEFQPDQDASWKRLTKQLASSVMHIVRWLHLRKRERLGEHGTS